MLDIKDLPVNNYNPIYNPNNNVTVNEPKLSSFMVLSMLKEPIKIIDKDTIQFKCTDLFTNRSLVVTFGVSHNIFVVLESYYKDGDYSVYTARILKNNHNLKDTNKPGDGIFYFSNSYFSIPVKSIPNILPSKNPKIFNHFQKTHSVVNF